MNHTNPAIFTTNFLRHVSEGKLLQEVV